MKKAVFFDRDGTLIVDKVYLNDPTQIEYLPGVFLGLQKLRDAGYLIIVVTNQSGVARGLVQIENLYKIHEILRSDFARHGVDIAGFYYAPYSVESNHHLRKPNPGMLELAARDFNIELSESFMVGDRDTDIQAGRKAGTKTILIASPGQTSKPDASVTNISQLVDYILNSTK